MGSDGRTPSAFTMSVLWVIIETAIAGTLRQLYLVRKDNNNTKYIRYSSLRVSEVKEVGLDVLVVT